MDNQVLRKITTGSFYLILDQVINYGLGALFWFILAKFVTTGVIGQAMLVIASATVVLGFAGSGAQITISKYVAEYNARKDPYGSRRVLIFGLKIGLLVSGVAAFIIALLANQISESFYNDSSLVPLLLLAVFAFLPSQTVVSCFSGLFQGSHKMKYTAITNMLYQVIRLLIVLVLVFAGFGSNGIIIGFAFASVVAAIVAYVLFVRKIVTSSAKKEDNSGYQQVVKFSGFNYTSVGVSALAAQLPYLLLGTQSFDLVALFGISNLIASMVWAITGSVSKTVLPTASAEFQKNDKDSFNDAINAALRLSITISGFIYIFLIVAPEYVLSLVGDNYTGASQVLRILVIAAILSSLAEFVRSILNGAGKAQRVTTISLISSVVSIGIGLIVIPILGLIGAGITLVIYSSLNLLTSLFFARKEKVLTLSLSSIARPSLCVFSSISIGFVALIITENSILALAVSCAAYLILAGTSRITTRSELKSLLQAIGL